MELIGAFTTLLTSTAGDEAISFLDLAIALATIIALAKLGGYISLRLNQPAVLGELLVGLLLGPSLLDFLHWRIFVYTTSFTYEDLVLEIHQLAEIGVLLLMFIAGLDLHIKDLTKSGKGAALTGVMGVLFPLGLGFGAAALYGFPTEEAFFIGLVLSATSVSISAQTLMELGKLRTRVGISLLGAAVLDDVLVILGLSLTFALVSGSGAGLAGILLILGRMILYVGLAFGFGFFVLPRLTTRISKLPVSQALLSFVIVTILVYAWLAEVIGEMAPITGAFIAGLLFARSNLKSKINSQLSILAYSVFVPIFFVSVGLEADVRTLAAGSLGFFLIMTLVAIIGKVVGAGLGATLAGYSGLESLQMGVGMMSRGEVGLIVATAGVAQGLMSGKLFTSVVGVILVTTLLTPIILRRLFIIPKADASQEEAEHAGPN
jgi:Kef-type K+ transport system membrane component KefB